MKNQILQISLLLLTLSACSHYRFQRQDNPLSQYDINGLSVPMFVNRSALPGASEVFTRYFVKSLNRFSGIKIDSSSNLKENDAILIGIIQSPASLLEAQTGNALIFTEDVGELSESLNNPQNPSQKRQHFYVPRNALLNLTLRILVIKGPSEELIQAAGHEQLGKLISNHPQVVIDRTFSLSQSYRNSLYGNQSINQGASVNLTQTIGLRNDILEEMAKSSADQFEQLVLYAF